MARVISDRHGLGIAMLAAAFPLLYVYMPRPPLPGAHLLVYPAVVAILLILSSILLGTTRSVDRRVSFVLILLLFTGIAAGISSLLNAVHLRSTAPLEILRPGVFGTVLLYGYYVGRVGTHYWVSRGLVWAAYLILAGQLVIAISQILGVPVVDFLYSEDKSRPFGSLLRVTGSLDNPNALGWIVAQASMMILLLSESRARFLWLGLGALLVIASGSRTVLILFPLMIVFASLFGRGGLDVSWNSLAVSVVIAAGFLGVIFWLGSYFPYLAQLGNVLTSGSLSSVNSFDARLDIWARAFDHFKASGDLVWIFGLGSRAETRVLDNDVLYVFFRLGALGLLAHFAVLAYAAVIFLRERAYPIAILGFQYLLFALLIGLLVDALGGWFVPLFLFYFVGLTIGLSRTSRDLEDLAMQAGSRGVRPWIARPI
jgi:hypothetical protein